MYEHMDPTNRSVYDPHSRKRRSSSPPTRKSSKVAYSRVTNRHSEDVDKSFWSSTREQRRTKNLPLETKNQPDSSTYELGEFVPGIHALPDKIFYKIISKKLDEFEGKEFAELSLLDEFITKAENVVANSLPPEMEAVARRMMLRKAGTYATSLGRNVASHQNAPSYLRNADPPYTNTYVPSSNESHSSNMASSSKTFGLTLTEQSQASSGSNTYQPMYPKSSYTNCQKYYFR